MDKKPIIIIAILCVISLGLGYLSGLKDKESPSKGDNNVQTTEKKEPDFLKEGLVAYYPFNGNAKDESGNGNDGEVKGPTLSADRHGKSDNAYSFDGVDDIITAPPLQNLAGSGLTLSIWVSPVSFDKNYPNIINIGRDKVAFYGKGPNYGGNKGRIGIWITPQSSGPQTQPIPLREWSHVVAISTGEKILLYWNGQLDDELVMNVGMVASSKLSIGALMYAAGDYEWHGSLDDIRIYNRALTEAEVKELYEFEKP